MPSIYSSAPAKCILFGEHAVVYGYPAIAIPLHLLRSKAVVTPIIHGSSGQVTIQAPDVNYKKVYSIQDIHDVFSSSLRILFDYLNVSNPPSFDLKITSSIPIASGLGSGASISIAIIRSVSAFLGRSLSTKVICELSFEMEKIHHGTPSGIDNTVITYEKPIYFIKDKPFTILEVKKNFELLIADSNIRSKTIDAVNEVRTLRESTNEKVSQIFNEICSITKSAKKLLHTGDAEALGKLLTQNHECLRSLGVSHSKLDTLVATAIKSGALGAKLTGAGLGGNIVALVDAQSRDNVEKELLKAGAKKVIKTSLSPIHRS